MWQNALFSTGNPEVSDPQKVVKNSSSTAPQFHNTAQSYFFEIDLSVWISFHTINWAPRAVSALIIQPTQSVTRHLLQELCYREKDVLTTYSNMDFYIGSALTAVKETTTVVLTRDLTLISLNWWCCCVTLIMFRHLVDQLTLWLAKKMLSGVVRIPVEHPSAVYSADSCTSECLSKRSVIWGTNQRVWTDKCVVSLSAWHVTQQWHGVVWIIQQRDI